jgi:type II secretory pathway component PulK
MAVRYVKSCKGSIYRLPDKKTGSILILVLWSLCLLSAFAVILGYQVRQKAVLIKHMDERSRLHFLAEAGIKKAISELKKDPAEDTYDTLADIWSSNPAAFKDINIGGGTVNICYNHINEQAGAQETRYGLVDEESKVYINNITDENRPEILQVLERLFTYVLNYNEMEAQELAACIVDWRDSDNILAWFSAGAENQYYNYLEYSYSAKNAKIEIPDELLLVKGMNEDIFKRIRNYITIYGNGKVNANTASKAVLLALGLNEGTAGKVIAFRAGDDGLEGTSDDNFFDTSSNIVPKLSAFTHLSAEEVAQLSNVAGKYLGTKSGNFFCRCLVKLNNSRDTVEMYSVINRNGKILYWREP